MRRLPTLLLLLLMGVPLWSQESFSLEGTVGSAVGTPEIYSLSMVGRVNFNTAVSAGIGVGLWNSGFASNWFKEYGNQTATLFRISDNQTVPSLQVNVRAERSLFSLGNKPLNAFIEPGLYFLPSVGRTVTLTETYYTGTPNPTTLQLDYVERNVNPLYSSQLATDNNSLFGWELKGGISLKASDNVAYTLSCAYQRIDLFQTLNTASMNTHETDERIELQRFSPPIGRFQIQLGFVYLFPLK